MRRPKVLALVLAGGAGGRLGPLTEQRAKPALPFAGVYRLIDFPLTNCVHSGIADVWVAEQYRPHALNDHLLNGRPWDLDRNAGGLRILPPFTGRHDGKDDEEKGFAEGNADVLWQHRELLAEFAADQIVVMSADHVERVDLRDVLDAHRDARAGVTVVTTQVAPDEASRFGIVQVGDDARVTGFDYKPEHPRGTTAATEVFAYDAPLLLATLDRLHAALTRDDSSATLGDFGDHLLPTLVADGEARAFANRGYWRDLGTLASYWQGHMDLLGEPPALVLDAPEWPVRTAAIARMPARIARSATIDDTLVSPGALVAGRVEHSVLGPGVVVEEGATVRDAVLLDGAIVRRGANVRWAVIDEGGEVGEGERVEGEEGEEPRVGGRKG